MQVSWRMQLNRYALRRAYILAMGSRLSIHLLMAILPLQFSLPEDKTWWNHAIHCNSYSWSKLMPQALSQALNGRVGEVNRYIHDNSRQHIWHGRYCSFLILSTSCIFMYIYIFRFVYNLHFLYMFICLDSVPLLENEHLEGHFDGNSLWGGACCPQFFFASQVWSPGGRSRKVHQSREFVACQSRPYLAAHW